MPIISKSKLVSGFTCKKKLWYELYGKNLARPYTESELDKFEAGRLVEPYAKQLYPGGWERTGKPWEYEDNHALTQQKIAKRTPVYEAAFLYHGLYCLVDIFWPSPDGKSWELIEVKSGTKAKPEYISY